MVRTTIVATHPPRHPSNRTVSDHVRGFGLQATQLPVHEAPQAVELQPCLPRVHTAPQAAPFGSRRPGGSSGTSGGVPKATTPRARVFSNGNEFKNSGGEVDSTCTFPNRGDPIALGGDASGVLDSELSMMSCDVRLSSSSQVLFRSSPPKKLSFQDFQEIF